MNLLRLAAVAAAVLLPLGAQGYEPRFDHRDQRGVVAALEVWREAVAVTGQPTFTEVQPRLRLGWGFDLSGEGDELILSGMARLGDVTEDDRARFLTGLDARYRGYFGTEELKTFFEVGLWVELQSELAIGPQAGIGLAYDPNRSWGAFLSLHFGTAFGQARIASLGASVGVQFRYE